MTRSPLPGDPLLIVITARTSPQRSRTDCLVYRSPRAAPSRVRTSPGAIPPSRGGWRARAGQASVWWGRAIVSVEVGTMSRVEFDVESSAAPERVIAGLTDFTPRRPELWPGLNAAMYRVYEVGDTWAEVQE